MLLLRGHTPFLLLSLPLPGLQVQHRRRAPHIEEVLAPPLIARPPTLAGPQVRQAMLAFNPLAHLRPSRPCRRALAQARLEGLVLRKAPRPAVSQGRGRALGPQGAAVARRSWELDYTPEAKRFECK
jgi:hypothetical protein